MMTGLFQFIMGATLWTLLEYLLHRFLGHFPIGFLKTTRFYKEHKKHHYKIHYFVSTKDKIMMVATLGVFFWFISFALSFILGLVSMYLLYEIIHRRLHTVSPKNRYAIFLRAHHFYHHDIDENLNHGVTSPIWDIVFGTYK
jgi:4-hydroxysphinganine ceramide fatty acyl 2-hydroxylase